MKRIRTTARTRRGFSLLELLLAVSIMGVIIVALYGMFYQVQRGLRANVTQVDVLEGSRATLDLLVRDLADLAPSDRALGTNVVGFTAFWPPVRQTVMGGGLRTNLLYDLTFLSRYNQDYAATRYAILAAGNGVGTLGRFSTNARPWVVDPAQLMAVVRAQPTNQFTPVLNGVIHFQATPYDALGWPMIQRPTNLYGPEVLLTTGLGGEPWFAFRSNALPAYLEIELGVLEPQVLAQYESFPPGSERARAFLADHAGQVHLFRQRVPIRLGSLMRPDFVP